MFFGDWPFFQRMDEDFFCESGRRTEVEQMKQIPFRKSERRRSSCSFALFTKTFNSSSGPFRLHERAMLCNRDRCFFVLLGGGIAEYE